MKRLFPVLLLVCAFCASGFAQQTAKPLHKRGAKPSPRAKLAAAPRFKAPATPTPANWLVLPPQNSMFLNDTYGDCVTAEEGVNINTYSYAAGGTCAIIGNSEIQSWAGKHGFLNGADLTSVMDAMAQSRQAGLTLGSTMYCDGGYSAVDWTNRAQLTAAIYACQGSIKISVDAGALENVVGSTNGWYLGSYSGTSQDHCVGLVGFGTVSYLAAAMGVSVPAGVDGNSFAYALDTWNTVGIVAAPVIESPWLGEAWYRNPTSVAVVGPAPTPTPTPPGPTPTWRATQAAALLVEAYQEGDAADKAAVMSVLLQAEKTAAKYKAKHHPHALKP